MADYISGNTTSRAPLVLGLLAVAIVIVLGLVAFGNGGGETDLSPTVGETGALEAPVASDIPATVPPGG